MFGKTSNQKLVFLANSFTFVALFMQYLHSIFSETSAQMIKSNFSIFHINMVDINMIITCCNKLEKFTSRKPFNAQSLFISQAENNNARKKHFA